MAITAACVTSQSVYPLEWVVVSDNSTDRTDEIVLSFAARHPWIKLLRVQERSQRSFASVVFATAQGVQALTAEDYTYLGLLDSDVRFGADFFERLMGKFDEDPSLGIAGGLVLDTGAKITAARGLNLREVAGATHFFRRTCFESLTRLVPIPEGGWDTITCVEARMNGFTTRTFPELQVDHLKPRNAAAGHLVPRCWQFGLRDYAVGNHPIFQMAKCLWRLEENPLLLGSLLRLSAYCWSLAKRSPRQLSPEIFAHLRHEQLARLTCLWH